MHRGKDIVDKLKEIMGSEGPRYRVAYAILYGSYARGYAGPLSDIDLLIEFIDRRLDLYRIGLLASTIEDYVKIPVDIVQYIRAPPSLRYKAFREGVTVYIGDKRIYVEDKRRAIMEWLDYSIVYNRMVKKYLEAILNGRSGANG